MKKAYSFVIVIVLMAVLIGPLSASDMTVRVWNIAENDWDSTVAILEGLAGEDNTLIAGGLSLEAPTGAWLRLDERRKMAAVYDSSERIEALQKLMQLDDAIDSEGTVRLFDVKQAMGLKTRDYVADKLRRDSREESEEVETVIFQGDLIISAPEVLMSEIATWVEEVQPKEPVLVETDVEEEAEPVRQTIMYRRRGPSTYLTGRMGYPDTRFLAGYTQSTSGYYSGMGTYGRSRSSSSVSLYGGDGVAVIDLHHQDSSYVLDSVGPMLEFSYRGGDFDIDLGTGRNFSFSNGVTKIW